MRVDRSFNRSADSKDSARSAGKDDRLPTRQTSGNPSIPSVSTGIHRALENVRTQGNARPVRIMNSVIGEQRAGTQRTTPCDPPSPSVLVRRIDASSAGSDESPRADGTVRLGFLSAPSSEDASRMPNEMTLGRELARAGYLSYRPRSFGSGESHPTARLLRLTDGAGQAVIDIQGTLYQVRVERKEALLSDGFALRSIHTAQAEESYSAGMFDRWGGQRLRPREIDPSLPIHRDAGDAIENVVTLHPGGQRVTVNGLDYRHRDESFPADVRAQIRTALRNPPPSMDGEALKALRQTALSFAMRSETGSGEGYLAMLAEAEHGVPLEHQLSYGAACHIMNLSQWGLTERDITIDLEELNRYTREEEKRVPDLAKVVSLGLHDEDPSFFAANRKEGPNYAITDGIERRMLADPATVAQARRIILDHLARMGPLSFPELLQLTGFSRKLLEPLVAPEKGYEPKEKQPSLLVSAKGAPPVMIDGEGRYRLMDAALLRDNQQRAIDEIEAKGKRIVALLDATERVLVTLSTLQEDQLAIPAPGADANAPIPYETQLRVVLDLLKSVDVVEQDLTFETWASENWRIAHPSLRSAEGIVSKLLEEAFIAAGGQLYSADSDLGKHHFSKAEVSAFQEQWIQVFEPIIEAQQKMRMRPGTNLPILMPAFTEIRKKSSQNCLDEIDVALDALREASHAQYASLSKIVSGNLPDDGLAAPQIAAAARTPKNRASYLEEHVKVPRLIVQELEKMAAEGIDAVSVVDHLQFGHITPTVAQETRAYLRARLTHDQAAQITSMKNVFALRAAHQIGAREFGDETSGKIMSRNEKKTHVDYYVNLSADATHIDGFFGISPTDLLGAKHTFDSVWSPFARNADLFIDGVVANAIGDEVLAESIRRELTHVFAAAFASGALDRAVMASAGTQRIAGFTWTELHHLHETIIQVMRVRAFLRLEADGIMSRDQFIGLVESPDMFKSFSRESQLLREARRPEDAENLDVDLILQHLVRDSDALNLELGLRLAAPAPDEHRADSLTSRHDADSIAVSSAAADADGAPLLKMNRQGSTWHLTVPSLPAPVPLAMPGEGEVDRVAAYHDAFGRLHARVALLSGRRESIYDIAVNDDSITIVSSQRLSNRSADEKKAFDQAPVHLAAAASTVDSLRPTLEKMKDVAAPADLANTWRAYLLVERDAAGRPIPTSQGQQPIFSVKAQLDSSMDDAISRLTQAGLPTESIHAAYLQARDFDGDWLNFADRYTSVINQVRQLIAENQAVSEPVSSFDVQIERIAEGSGR